VLDENYRFVIFTQPKEASFDEKNTEEDIAVLFERVVAFLKGTLEAVQTACMESLGASINFALSGQPCNWETVSRKYISLSQLLNYRIGTDIEMLLIDNEIKNDISHNSTDTQEKYNDDEAFETMRQWKLDTIELYLESGQKDKYFEVLSQMFEPIKLIKSKNCKSALEAYCKVSLSILSYINRYKLNEKIALYMDIDRLMKTDSLKTWKEEIEYIYQLSELIFTLQNAEQKKRADNTIEYIQKYIEDHLSEELSLVRLAEKVYLNPSYLSRLYKQVMGTNLSEFIDNARIQMAKKFLEKENMKINEVAKLVGYESAASFSRFFRKITGYSPQEYQDKLLADKIRNY
jgi:two-component system response regulator YesN